MDRAIAAWTGFARSLRARAMWLVLAAMMAIAIPAAGAFLWLVDRTVVRLGTLFAEKQILFDRYRGLESLMREVSLAETVARSPAILAWAADEGDPEKAKRGLAELEHYRLSFKDRSYFMVIDGSGNYYFNDKDNSYENDRLRYTLSRDNPRDGWYRVTAARGSGCHLNVDHDDTLAVTKVWVNCIIRQDGRMLGIIGTGVDLSRFIQEVVNLPQTGVQSMFVDLNGAVQAHRDRDLVDFHSLTKDLKAKNTIFRMLDRDSDRAELARMMREVSAGGDSVQSRFMRMDGKEMLVGVGYLDRLGWFNVTVMDVDQIIDRRLFAPMALLLALMLVAAAALMSLLFKRSVLDRLARLEVATTRLRAGDFRVAPTDRGDDEIGRLARGFDAMAREVGEHTSELERAVRERTEKLERLAYIDSLTEVLNRRGFVEAYAAERNRARRTASRNGLLIVDIDRFKTINDSRGHQAGDDVIVELVRRMRASLRNYDVCARWGGDEFIVLIADCDPTVLAAVAGKLVAAVRATPMRLGDGREQRVTISVGCALAGRDDELTDVAANADAALYEAKRGGRNRFVIYDPARHAASARNPA